MFEAATKLIETKLDAEWTETPIDYDNVEFNPVLGTSFVRLQVEWVTSAQKSIGGRTQGEGYIDVSIFVPANTGVRSVNAMADRIAAVYERYADSGLVCGIPRTVRVGQQEEWYQLKVLTPFKYDQCFI